MADVIPARGKVLLGVSSTSRGSYRDAVTLPGYSHHTIARSVAARRRR
jgi:hypothetical protein